MEPRGSHISEPPPELSIPSGRVAAGSAPAPRRARLREALVLLAVTAAFGAAWVGPRFEPYRWLHGDGAFYYNVAAGLLSRGTLVQDENHPRSWYEDVERWNRDLDAAFSNVGVGRDGRTWWPKHPWLFPLVAAPFVFAGGAWGAFLFNGLLLLAVPLLAWRAARALASPAPALAAALVFAAAAVLSEHAWSFSNDLLYTALALAAFDQAFRHRPVAAGVLLGLAVVAKFTLILLAPALGLVFLLRRDLRGLFRLAAGVAGPVLVLLAANWYMFGGLLTTGYHRILVVEGGQTTLHSHVDDFHWSALGAGLRRNGGALLRAWPVLALVPVGLWRLVRRGRAPEAAALALGMAVPVVFHAPYTWFRLAFVLPAVALSVPVLAALGPLHPEPSTAAPRLRRWVGVGAAVLGLLLGVGGLRHVLGAGDWLSGHIREARVFLGDVPCDYFNPQVHAWECAGYDRGRADLMTGPTASPRVEVDGRQLVRLSPHPSARPRRLAWPLPDAARRVELLYGLPSGARPAVRFRVRAGEAVLWEERVGEPGLTRLELELPVSADRLVLEVEGRRPAPFGVDARPLP